MSVVMFEYMWDSQMGKESHCMVQAGFEGLQLWQLPAELKLCHGASCVSLHDDVVTE